MDHQQAVATLASERYLLGEMNVQERDAFEDHFFSCVDCGEDVRAAAAMRDAVKAGMLATTGQNKTSGGTVLQMPARRRVVSTMLPWAIAASLALAVVYQTLTLRPAGSGITAVALSPVTLRPASRGQETTLSAGSGGTTLAVDLGGASFPNGIAYEMRDASGRHIVSGQAAAPYEGAPLLLLIGANLTHPGEHYVLSLKDPGNAGLTAAEYRFTVEAR